MERKEFLEKMALGTGVALALTAFPACFNKAEAAAFKKKGPITIDLEHKKNKALATAGGFIYHKGMIVAHLNDGSYAAVTKKCSHFRGKILFKGTQNEFKCKRHGALFNTKGEVLKGPAKVNLRVYDVTVEGSKLIIKI